MDTPIELSGAESITLHLPAQFRYLALARDAALEACQRLQFPEFDCYKVEMAVDEACTHIIEHGYHGEVPPEEELDHPGLTVVFAPHTDHLLIEITDRGDGFDFDTRQETSPDEYVVDGDEQGLGLYIIKRFVDHVEYQQDPQHGNRLRLTKHR